MLSLQTCQDEPADIRGGDHRSCLGIAATFPVYKNFAGRGPSLSPSLQLTVSHTKILSHCIYFSFAASVASHTMVPRRGTTAVRTLKPTSTSKGKAQPTSTSSIFTHALPYTETTMAEAKANSHQSTSVQVTRRASDSSQLSIAPTAQQSSDVVQTFLFSAVSTILWMRDLLPESYFRTAFYAAINKHCSYRDFTDDSDNGASAQGDRSRPKGYHLSILKRDVSTRGNQIIEWMVSGLVSVSIFGLVLIQCRSRASSRLSS